MALPAGFAHRLRLPPLWTLPLAAIAGAAALAWRAVSAAAGITFQTILQGLIWPGLAVGLAVYLFAWLGWALDID